MAHRTIGFIGAGNMALSLAGGLLQNGWPRAGLALSDADPERRKRVGEMLGLEILGDNHDVAGRADVLVLAVKPQVLKGVCEELRGGVHQKKPLVVSIAAGIRTADLARWLGPDLPIVRAMPNTPALVGAGSTGLFANPRVSDAQRGEAESILRAVGVVVWLEHESQLDTVTALSGSGPAYFFLVMEALENAAIESGLDRATARLLTIETAYGAAKMAEEGNEDPAALRARVTSPGGTTEKALAALEAGDLRGLFRRALTAAEARSREIADFFGKD